jgi:hypothetical protein
VSDAAAGMGKKVSFLQGRKLFFNDNIRQKSIFTPETAITSQDGQRHYQVSLYI